MESATELIEVNDATIGRVMEAESAALVLSRQDCAFCQAYDDEIRQAVAAGRLEGIEVIGKVVLDQPGSGAFKRENRWIRDIAFLPYTVLYRKGQRVDGFGASRVAYLRERIRRLRAPTGRR